MVPGLPPADHESEDGISERRAPRRILSESEQRLLSHHPGPPEDHHHYLDAPLDREAARLLRRGALDDVVSLAEVAPTRVAEMMGRHRIVLARASRQVSFERLLLLTWDSLDAEMRRQYLYRMVCLVIRMARAARPYRRRRDGPMVSVPYAFHSDDLDLEATVERKLSYPAARGSAAPWAYADLIVRERSPRPRAYTVMLDTSRSMRGSKAVSAALVTATLLFNLTDKDRWGIVTFGEKSQVLRGLGDRRLHDGVIHELLELRSEGCTDIAGGLEAGLGVLAKAQTRHRIGILVTDGWLNTGPSPLALARHFSNLHVIKLSGGDPALCARMAQAGRGTMVGVRSLTEVPGAARQCLCA